MKKTFKRELGLALIFWLVYIVETKDVQIIEILVWPIFTYVSAAFGIDAYGKLFGNKPTGDADGRGTERSGEYADR